MRRAHLSLILLSFLGTVIAGCVGEPNSVNLAPFEFTYIRIGQDQYSTGGLHPEYEGSIAFPACIRNPNPRDLTIADGWEVFQQWGPPHAEGLRLVARYDSGPHFWFANAGSAPPAGEIHNVLLNETVEGNSTHYTIHLWNEIIGAGPSGRVDRWFNMTFMPYAPGSTTYREGTPC